jgi:hypothetical protein
LFDLIFCAGGRYELGTEFEEALEHHLIPARNTKILLKVADFGTAY